MALTAKTSPGGNMRLWDATGYRLPPSGWVSILHRVSGIIMAILLPFIIWMFDTSVTSEVSFASFTSVFTAGWGFVPGFLFKLVALVLIWSYLHHLIAGLRHLWMDATHATTLKFGRSSAIFVLASSLLLTVVLGARLFIS